MKITKLEDLHRWTVTDFDELFLEAAETERNLPPAFRKQKMSSWPDYVQSWNAYGWTEAGPVRVAPSAAEIDRLDLAMNLGLRMPTEDRQIVWAVAHSAVGSGRGPKWTKLSKMLGCSRHTVKADYAAALIRLTWIIDPKRARVMSEGTRPINRPGQFLPPRPRKYD